MNKEAVLDLLRAPGSAHHSGTELARRLGVSRAAIWKHIKALEADGYGIEAVPSKGYRIISEPDLLRRAELKRLIGSGNVGRTVHYLAETGSTNTRAAELAVEGAAEGTVVVAESQTGGKGRLGRSWISPKGNLYFSVIFRPPVAPQRAPLMTLMGAVAVASALKTAAGVDAGIKWPNDILMGGKKVCGLLTEMSAEADRIRHLVLGIGINCNMDLGQLPGEIRHQATSLAAATGRPVDRTQVLAAVLIELDRAYRTFLDDPQGIIAAWNALNVTIGRRITVAGAGEKFRGTASGIDTEGRLIMMLDDGSTRIVAAGDVTIVKDGEE